MVLIKLESPLVKSIIVLQLKNFYHYCDYPYNGSKSIKQVCCLKFLKIKQDARENLLSITLDTTQGQFFGMIYFCEVKIVFLQIKGFKKIFARIYLREFDFSNNFRALIFAKQA